MMKLQRKGIYLLPNILTLISLYFGFKSIIDSIDHQYIGACQDIFISLVFDGLDGRIARLTNTQSHFGAELDSLADMVSFGLAPSFMLYQYGLAPLGKVGFILCFILTATTSLRLARFNSFQSKFDKRFFEGLPCPAAAGFIGASIWLIEFFKIKLFFQKEIFAFIALFLSVAMISSVPFLSFKVFDRSKIPLYGFMLLVVFFSLIALHPPIALFLIFFAYIFLQPLFFLVKKIRKKPVTDSHY